MCSLFFHSKRPRAEWLVEEGKARSKDEGGDADAAGKHRAPLSPPPPPLPPGLVLFPAGARTRRRRRPPRELPPLRRQPLAGHHRPVPSRPRAVGVLLPFPAQRHNPEPPLRLSADAAPSAAPHPGDRRRGAGLRRLLPAPRAHGPRPQRRPRLRGPLLPLGPAPRRRGQRPPLRGRRRRRAPRCARGRGAARGAGRPRRHAWGTLLRRGARERRGPRVPRRDLPHGLRRGPPQRRRIRAHDAEARPRRGQRDRRRGGGRRGEAPGPGRHGRGPLLGAPRRRRRELRRRGLLDSAAGSRAARCVGLHRPPPPPGRRPTANRINCSPPDEMAARGARAPRRPVRQGGDRTQARRGRRESPTGGLQVTVPRQLQRHDRRDEHPFTRARDHAQRLQRHELDSIHALLLRLHRRPIPRGAPRSEPAAQGLLQDQAGLPDLPDPGRRSEGPPRQDRRGQGRVHRHRPAGRCDGRDAGVRHAVRAPARVPVQRAVLRQVGRRRERVVRGRAPGVGARGARVHGAVRELEAPGGVHQLQGPGPGAERGGGDELRGGQGVGGDVLQGKLQEAGHGEGRGGSRAGVLE